jgi:hypothetical protein
VVEVVDKLVKHLMVALAVAAVEPLEYLSQ